MTKRKKLNLKVIFDTNVIYTGSASDLLRNEIVKLIDDHKSLSDIEIDWYLSETVIMERIFQMNKKANDLLPSIVKLEKLLGHNLNITQEIVQGRVSDTVNKQLTSFGIKKIKIDTSKVDWESIINNSLNRLPPFEDNEKEKGFRDALILEGLKHVISSSPVTKSVCRIIFITNDGPLSKAAKQIDKLPSNVYVYPDIDELISLINILDSEITEDRIAKIITEAEKLFFESGDDSSLFYTQDIRHKITSTFSEELNIKENGANSRENGTWWIAKPGFESKNKQHVTWKNIITVDFTSYKTVAVPNAIRSYTGNIEPFQLGMTGLGNANNFQTGMGLGLGSYNSPGITNSKEKMGSGKTRFEVTWSVTLTTDNKLKSPKIDAINYLDTIIS